MGAAIVFTLVLIAVFAPVFAPTGYAEASLEDNYATPSLEYPLGADFWAGDMLSRLIYGARVSLSVGIVGATLATILGVAYGSISGYYGGRLDNWMMRVVDVLYGLPTVLVIILIMVYFRSATLSGVSSNPLMAAVEGVDDLTGGVFLILVGIGITSWLTTSRLVRGMVLSLKEDHFIEAARAVGASDARIIYRHLVPNFLGTVIVAETLNVPGYILIEAFLSFIGLGVEPSVPSWGGMIAEGFRGLRSYPHLVVFPSIALSVTLLAFNLLGDGLRDALDPRTR